MAGAEIIGAAIGVLLLVLVGYIMVGSTLSSAEIVASAQKDLTMQNEARLRTAIEITAWDHPSSNIFFNVSNQGDETISDFSHMDVYLSLDSTNPPTRYQFGDGTGGTWNITHIVIDSTHPEIIHPTILDPGERMQVKIELPAAPPSAVPVKIVTNNGVTASEIIV